MGNDIAPARRRTVTTVGDQRRAMTAYTRGNLGGWARERYAPDVVDHDDDDFVSPGGPAVRSPWWIRLRGRAVRWGLVAGVFLAYINHWPGGH